MENNQVEVTAAEPTEAQLIAEEVNSIAEQKQGTPEMSALEFIMFNLPRFRAKLEHEVTGVQAKRVLSRLIESPLEEETAPFTTDAAIEVFNLGMQIQNAKHILFLTGMKENADKSIQEVASANDAAETKNEETVSAISEMSVEQFYEKWIYRDPGECPTIETFRAFLNNNVGVN